MYYEESRNKKLLYIVPGECPGICKTLNVLSPRSNSKLKKEDKMDLSLPSWSNKSTSQFNNRNNNNNNNYNANNNNIDKIFFIYIIIINII